MRKTEIKKLLSNFKSTHVKITFGVTPACCKHYDKLYETDNPDFIIADHQREGFISLGYNSIEYIFAVQKQILVIVKRGIIINLSPDCESVIYVPYSYVENLPCLVCKWVVNGEIYTHFKNSRFYEEILESYYNYLFNDKMNFRIQVNSDNFILNTTSIPYEKIKGHLYKNHYLYLLIESKLIGLPLTDDYSLLCVWGFIRKKIPLPVETVSETRLKIKRMNHASVYKSFSKLNNKHFNFEYTENYLIIRNIQGDLLQLFKYSDFSTIDYYENFYLCYLPDTDCIFQIHITENIMDVSPA